MTPMSTDTRIRLSIMMFLQYAFNGIWFIPLVTYLNKVGYTGEEGDPCLLQGLEGSNTIEHCRLFLSYRSPGQSRRGTTISRRVSSSIPFCTVT